MPQLPKLLFSRFMGISLMRPNMEDQVIPHSMQQLYVMDII